MPHPCCLRCYDGTSTLLTHPLLLPCIHICRYAKFLLLRKHHLELQHPIPPLDIVLMWSSHMSASGLYAADCQQLLQRTFLDLPGALAARGSAHDGHEGNVKCVKTRPKT
jgi:hypothetical protein